MTARRVLAVGHSHILALVDAARERAAQLGGSSSSGRSQDGAYLRFDIRLPHTHLVCLMLAVAGPALAEQINGEARGYPPAADELRHALDTLGGYPEQLVSCLFGSEHSAFALIDHPIPIDFLESPDDPGSVPFIPGTQPRQVVPRSVMERVMNDYGSHTVVNAMMLQRLLPDTPMAHVLPPPPIADAAHIRSDPEVFAPLIGRYGVAPAPLRRKSYRLFCELLRPRLAAAGIVVLDAPPQAVDDGYLAAPYWQGATHGNTAYGHLILDQLGIA